MSNESEELADIAQRAVENLGASNVAVALGCRGNQLPHEWLTKAVPVHPAYEERLRILDKLFTRLSEATSVDEARSWLTTFQLDMQSQPLAAIRYRQFMEVEASAARFLGSISK